MKPSNTVSGALFVWVASYLFFLFSLASNFSASHDSINYLKGIVSGKQLFHQHHLLYNYLAHQWLKILSPVLPEVADHFIIEAFTALWGSCTLSVCYLLFRKRFNLSRSLAAIGVSVIAFSYGTWFYSVNVEVYAPPLFFISVALNIITKKAAHAQDVWKVSILHSLSVLFHQVNILFGFVVLYWIFRNRNVLKFYPSFFRYATISLILTGGLYFLVGWLVEGYDSPADFTAWILGYTIGHNYWQPVSMETPLQVLAGFTRAFAGVHFIFQLPGVEQFLQQSFHSHGLNDEKFLSRNISSTAACALTFLTAVSGILILTLTFRFLMRYRLMKMHMSAVKPLLVCLFVYSMFFIFWMPEIPEFWILQMVIVWLLLIGMVPVIRFPFNINPRAVLMFLSLSLFIINYFGSIRWLQDINHDWYYMEVKKISSTVQPGDLVIVENEWILKDYVRYYTKAEVVATDEPGFNRSDTESLVKEIISKNGKVFLYPARETKGARRWKVIRSY